MPCCIISGCPVACEHVAHLPLRCPAWDHAFGWVSPGWEVPGSLHSIHQSPERLSMASFIQFPKRLSSGQADNSQSLQPVQRLHAQGPGPKPTEVRREADSVVTAVQTGHEELTPVHCHMD